MGTRAGLLLGTSVLLSLAGCRRPAELALTPTQWDFGTIPAAAAVEGQIEVNNPGRRATEVRLISTCACLSIEPAAFELAGRARAAVRLRYDPSQDEGDVRMQIIVRSGRGARRQTLRVYGRVQPQAVAALEEGPALRGASAQLPQFLFHYYYDPGCKGCEVFLVRQMVALQQELGIRLQVARHDISQAASREQYLRRLEDLGVEERAYPAVVFGDAVLQGDEQISRELGQVLTRALAGAEEGSGR